MLLLVLSTFFASSTLPMDKDWQDLILPDSLSNFRGTPTGWMRTTEVTLNKEDKKKLAAVESASTTLVNLPAGRASNLVTKEVFRDVEVSFEFLIPERSNAGIKFIGHYEIQILDSFGKKDEQLTGSDCGGVYPRGERFPRYHVIDKGVPPKTNACKAPGEWQKLEILFRAPRFSDTGKKLSPAIFEYVKLNGVLIHENVKAITPTGSDWRKATEVAEGPIMIQGDHGPFAFKNLKVRKITKE